MHWLFHFHYRVRRFEDLRPTESFELRHVHVRSTDSGYPRYLPALRRLRLRRARH